MTLLEIFGLFGQSKINKKRKEALLRVKTKERAKRDAARVESKSRDDERKLNFEVDKGNEIRARAKDTPKPRRKLKDV